MGSNLKQFRDFGGEERGSWILDTGYWMLVTGWVSTLKFSQLIGALSRKLQYQESSI